MRDPSAQIDRVQTWYHTFDLPDSGPTRGVFDLRGVVAKLPLPATLEGKRCLDAAACEGFWSFELARRGAAEVVSLDLPETDRQDWQGLQPLAVRRVGTGLANEHFELARRALGLTNVTRVDMNLYDLTSDQLGSFDYVFVGNVLIHLADPVRALKALRAVMNDKSELLSLEATSLALTLLAPRLALAQLWDWDDQPRWWTPNKAAHRRLLHAAGFEILDVGGPLFQPFGEAMQRWPKRLPRSFRELLYWSFVRRIGPASAWVRARPRPVKQGSPTAGGGQR